MSVGAPVPIPFPLSSFPGSDPQESEGRLINGYVEPLGESEQKKYKWIRSAGLSLHALTANSGYRGGLVVNSASIETWANNASSIDASGNVTSIGSFPGTKKVTIARNQAAPVPDVVAVDLDHGAYVLGSATVTAATATITILSANFNAGGTITLVFSNPALTALDPTGFPVSITYTIAPSDTASSIAAALNALINANSVLSAANLTSTVVGPVITASHQGSIGNQTVVSFAQQNAVALTATNIGTATSSSGATCALTGVTVPAGSLIMVCINSYEALGGSCSDSLNGTYTFGASQILGGGGSGYQQVFYFANSAALSSGTITFTKKTIGSVVTISAFYVTGAQALAPIDPAVTASTGLANTSSPSITSGVPSSDFELIVGMLAVTGDAAITYTQASGFSTPPVEASQTSGLNYFVEAGGTILNPTKTAVTFNPTLTTSGTWGWSIIVMGVIPGGGASIATLTPSTGDLSGGAGTYGAFTGAPTAYTGQGSLSGPNSVAFQDGYFFFTEPGGTVYATLLNSLIMNALTYVTIQGKADVTLLRAVPFSGLMMFFTTGSCEVWQDAALASPNFPYSRLAILEFGLVQVTALAGWETGFSELLWVAQDFGVHWMTSGSLSQIKVSPPDLDRLIEAQVRAGNTLEAGCYVAGGKKFWTLSCASWTWEFNLQTRKWCERWSLVSGAYTRWRGTGGHPAFGKWLMGDQQGGNLVYADDTNKTEVGSPILYRLESGPVKKFPADQQIARADFDFVVGVGQAVGSTTTSVEGAASGTGGVVRLQVFSTAGMSTNDEAVVSGVVGTTEANGTWPITIIDATHIELQGSVFANAYVSGGSVVDISSPSNVQSPQVAISCSLDGGRSWGNPLMRSLGEQMNGGRVRVSVTRMGVAGPMGARWRLDVTDEVYVSFMGGTQASDIRMVGT